LECYPVVLQPVFEGVPRQFESVFKALDYTLTFQLVERLNPGFEGITQQGECAGEVGETVFPTGFGGHPAFLTSLPNGGVSQLEVRNSA
jgi:hypothetical protein